MAESLGSDVIKPQNISESTASIESDDKLDDKILNDPLTLLSTEQHNKLKQDGYCMIDDPSNNKEIELIVCGYVRENYNGNQMEQYVIKEMVYFYGTQWNSQLFIELICTKPTAQHFLVPRRNLKLSAILNDKMNEENEENDGITNKIELNDIPCDTLHFVLRYLGHHRGIIPGALPCPVRSIHMTQIVSDQWDAQYIDPLEKKVIFEIIIVANNLQIEPLKQLGCAKIATLIKQMDQSEINRIIDEEERYRREHANDNQNNNDNGDNGDNGNNDNDNQNEDDEEKMDTIETIQ